MSLFAGIGITLALFFSVLLLTKRQICTADRWLSGWFFILFIHASYLASAVEQTHLPTFIAIIAHPLFLLYGPAMYSYVMQVSLKKPISNWHFLPYIAIVVIFLNVNQFGPDPGNSIGLKGLTLFTRHDSVKWVFFLLNSLMGLYLLYPLLAIRQIKRHKKNLEAHYSDLSKVELNWIAIWIYSGLCGVVIAITINVLPSSLLNQRWIEWVVFSGINLQMLYVGIKGLQQTQIFVGPEAEVDVKNPIKEKGQLKPSVDLTDDIAALRALMASSKPYLEASLMSEQLASQLKWSTLHLTKVINQGLNQSFFEFINRYRIEAAKSALIDPKYQNCTILAVAYDVGFNSKTSFNTAFKKYQGITPSAYKKNHSV